MAPVAPQEVEGQRNRWNLFCLRAMASHALLTIFVLYLFVHILNALGAEQLNEVVGYFLFQHLKLPRLTQFPAMAHIQ